MDTKHKKLSILSNNTKENSILNLYYEFVFLKDLFRKGWLTRGIPEENCESVAEHTLGVTLLCLTIAEVHFPELDILKVLKMAIIHDFGEVYVGDIIPSSSVSKAEKYSLEHQAITKLFSNFPEGAKYISIWEEFEEGKTAESKFVKQIDKLEMSLQASVYAKKGYSDLDEFFQTTSLTLSDDCLKELHLAVVAGL